MPNLGYVSSFNINGNELSLKDAALTEIVEEIIEAIGANNGDISERINNLHDRSFDALIKISSQNESEISNVQDGMYKLQYVTVTGEGDDATETLNNSAILIQKGANQYLYKDGQISSRTKANSTWGTWTIDNHPVTSVNGMTGAVVTTLSSNYATATGTNSDLLLASGDTYEHAFGKLEKEILDNELITAAGMNDLNDQITNIIHPVSSVNGMTGAVVLNIPVTSVNGMTGAVTITETQLSKGTATGTGNAVTDVNVSNHQITLVKGATYTTPTEVQNAVATGIASLVNSAPETLDTLNELATALGNDPNFATTVASQIGQKYTKPSTGIPASDLEDGVIPNIPVTSVNGMTGAVTVNVPVQSVNGQTGAVTINTGVTSFNGATGAITYTAPVTSVNGATGAVTVKANVQSDWNATTGDSVILNKPNIILQHGNSNNIEKIVFNDYTNVNINYDGGNYDSLNINAEMISLNATDTAYYKNKEIAVKDDIKVTSVNGMTGAVTITHPVTSVNGQTGAVTVNVPVTSVDGKTGAVTITHPVTSVNGQTGAVTITHPVTSVNGQTGTVTITHPVTSVNGQTGAVTITHPVTSVNGQTGAVSLSIPSKTSDLINDSKFIQDYGTGSVSVIKGGITNAEEVTLTTPWGNSYGAVSVNPGGVDIISNWGGSANSVNENGSKDVNIYTSNGKAYYNSKEIATVDQIVTPPVTSVNGQTGVVTVNVGVTSFNGSTGAITYTAPVTSVNGQTGAVTLTIPAAVTESTVSGWGFTKNTGTLTTETQLSKGTATGTGNAVTDINVSNHQITLVKGATYATQEDINESISNLVNSAPATLDTLNELATALGNDPNFATTVATQIGEKYTKPSTGIPASDLAAGVIPTVPVQSVNGQTGAVNINVGVTSFNGATGAVTYTAPVTSVNGATGAVNLTIPTVNNSTVTITMNGNTVGTFTLNKSGNTTIDLGTVLTSHQSIKTINNQTITGSGNVSLNTLPTVSASDNGKVLMVVNGAWQLVSPVTLYSGSGTPANSQGNNGDLYVQS